MNEGGGGHDNPEFGTENKRQQPPTLQKESSGQEAQGLQRKISRRGLVVGGSVGAASGVGTVMLGRFLRRFSFFNPDAVKNTPQKHTPQSIPSEQGAVVPPQQAPENQPVSHPTTEPTNTPTESVDEKLSADEKKEVDNVLKQPLGADKTLAKTDEEVNERQDRMVAEEKLYEHFHEVANRADLTIDQKLDHIYEKAFLAIQTRKDLRKALYDRCSELEEERIQKTYTPEQKKVWDELKAYAKTQGYNNLSLLLAVRAYKEMIPFMSRAQEMYPKNYIHETTVDGKTVTLRAQDLLVSPGFLAALRGWETGDLMNIGDLPAMEKQQSQAGKNDLVKFAAAESEATGQQIDPNNLIGDQIAGAVEDQLQPETAWNAEDTLRDLIEAEKKIGNPNATENRLNFSDPRYGFLGIMTYLAQTVPSLHHYGYNITPLGVENGIGLWNGKSKSETETLIGADQDFRKHFSREQWMLLS